MRCMIHLGRKGVSEIVGTVLLLAIAVTAFSVLAIYVYSNTSPSTAPPDLNLAGYLNEEQHIIIEHKGGDDAKLGEVKLTIWKGEVDSVTFHFNANGELVGEHGTFSGDGDGYWNLGEYIDINATAIFGNITHWQISAVVIDDASNSIIFSGILQSGITRTVPPVVRFTYAPWDPKTQEIVVFNASQSYDPDGGSIVTYQWDFNNDGVVDGYGVVVVHQYTSAGTYNVSLTITDDEGQTASATTGYGLNIPGSVNVTDNQYPIANFSWNNDTGTTGVVAFYDHSYDSDGIIVSWYWNFGDGAVDTSQNPSHYYNRSGTYTVTLIVTDDNGATNSTSFDVVVPNILPEAFFSYTPENPSTKHYIFFDATGSFDRDGTIQNYSWDFDNDGQFDDAYGTSPSTIFTTTGNHTVSLKVIDDMGGIDIEEKNITVVPPSTYRSVLIVDNTPTSPRSWDGISNIVQAVSNLGFDYSTGKAIDSWQFVGGTEAGKNITDTLLDEYDIVIWSTGDFPGDGGDANWDGINNTWSTPMTEGSDDTSDHVYEMYEHLTHNGTLLMCGAYAVRDLQDYPGNGINSDEEWLGDTLGLIEPTGGINEGYHSGITGYFADDYYSGDTFGYGPIMGAGTLNGTVGTSSYSDTYGVANLVIQSPIYLYELNKKSGSLYNYSLTATGGGGTVLQEGFESGFPPNGWAEYVLGFSNPGWQSTTRAGRKCAYHDYTNQGWKNCNDWLVSPQFTVPNGGTLTFLEWNKWMQYYTYHGVWISTGSGNPSSGDFIELQEMSSSTNQNWISRSIDISSYAGQNVYIAFVYQGGDGAEWAIDDVEVSSSGSYIPTGQYAIDATRGANRSIVLGFDLNSDAITEESREAYLRNVLNWMAEGVGYATEVYVDNDRPLDWYDDTHVHTIQEGIDAVSFGGTVYVYDGDVYNGAVVDKSINLVAIGNPEIQASGEAGIKITADWVWVDGFVIQNIAGQTLQRGIYIANCSRITVRNCTISDAAYGIHVYHSYNSTVQNNIIDSVTYGVRMHQSSGLNIRYNEIHNGTYGVSLTYSIGCAVMNNEINSNDEGIYLYESDRTNIRNNQIYSNTDYGLRLVSTPTNNYIINNTIYQNGYGIFLELSTRNTIQNNNISSNIQDGIHIVSGSSQNTIWNNTISDNNYGIYMDSSGSTQIIYNTITQSDTGGIYMTSSGGNILTNNLICLNTGEGIYIRSSSDSNAVLYNTVYNNSYGVRISTSRNNVVDNNTIYNNSNTGIYLERPDDAVYDNNTISSNILYSNTQHGICLYSASGSTFINNTVFQNGGDGIHLYSSSDANTIRNNTIWGNDYGIFVQRGNFNLIANNTINNSALDGIYINTYSSENDMFANIIIHNRNGIQLQASSINNISGNTIALNSGKGVYFSGSSLNVIYSNQIYSNTQDGIYLSSSDSNTITKNHIWNNENGIYLVSSGGTGNTIINNTIYSHSGYGILLENSRTATAGNNELIQNEIYSNSGGGICLYSSNINSLQNNEIYSNGGAGIYLHSSDSNTLQQNALYQNTEHGLYLNSSNNNDIQGNNISFNGGNGMYILDSSQGDSLPIQDNLIWNNSQAGINISSSSNNYFTYNIIWNNSVGLSLYDSSTNNEIRYTILHNNSYGIYINASSTNNVIRDNNVTRNEYSVYIGGANCRANELYDNNFLNNTLHNESQAYDMGNNSWYVGTEGNYWSDRDPLETYYIIPPYGTQDKYPLASPRTWWL